MHGHACCPPLRSRVVKASDPAARYEAAFADVIADLASLIRSQITDEAVALAMRTGDPRAVLDRLPPVWGKAKTVAKSTIRKAPADDAPVVDVPASTGDEAAEDRIRRLLLRMIDEAAKREIADLGRSLGRRDVRVRWDLTNPHSFKWIREHAASMVQGVTFESQEAIASVLSHGFEQGVPVRDMARQIREVVGLNQRQAAALMNRREVLTSQGLSPADVDRQAGAYARRLLRERGEMIARTETIAAMAEGQRGAWKVATDQGVLPPGMKRKWIDTTGSARTCSICSALGQHEPVGLDEAWTVTVNGRTYSPMNPPSHVNCRCSTGLVVE